MSLDQYLSHRSNQLANYNLVYRHLVKFLADYLVIFNFFIAIVGHAIYRQDFFWIFFFRLALTIICVVITVFTLKTIVGRKWPYLTDRAIRKDSSLMLGSDRASFPSSHTALSFTLALVVLTSWPIFGIILLTLAFLVSLGRLLSGVHYLSDILAGTIIAIIFSEVVNMILGLPR
jgi:undecaprenyl-diphosphatase